MKCIKCSNEDINIEYKSPDDADYDSEVTYKNLHDFCKTIDWQRQGYTSYSIQKEHLKCVCKICKFTWLQQTADKEK